MSPTIPYSKSIPFGPTLFPPADSICEGLPTKADIDSYEVMFSWEDLCEILIDGDLGLLRRPVGLQARYDVWCDGIRKHYGSTENYLLGKRVHFPPPAQQQAKEGKGEEATCFRSDADPSHYCLTANDWPYSTPRNVYHFVIWTHLPLIPSSELTPALEQDGLNGFTGSPHPSRSPPNPSEGARYELGQFVKDRWPEEEWETAWFMNPPRLQSVKKLPHYHVFARRKGEAA